MQICQPHVQLISFVSCFHRYGLPHLAVNLWIVGVFTLAVTIINLPFMLIDKSLTPLWIAAFADFCFITFYWLYLWGLLFQELDYGQKWWRIMIHLPCAIVIQPFASIAEGLSAIWAMSSVDFGKFEVIVKYVFSLIYSAKHFPCGFQRLI